MSKNPVFDSTLLDHRDLLGTSLLFAEPVTPTYVAQNWVPAKKVDGWGEFKDPRPEQVPEWKTFLRCLSWWRAA